MTLTFVEQLLSNFLATIAAGLLLYFGLEKRIKDNLKKSETNKLLKNLAGDLSYNYMRAKKAIEHEDEYLSTDRFTLSRYETRELKTFYYQKPFSEGDKFPYLRLLGLITKLEDNNVLAELVFSSANPEGIKANKTQYLKQAKEIMAKAVDFLNDIEPFYKNRGIVLTEYS